MNGDLNRDDVVTLQDAVLCLQTLAGTAPIVTVYSSGDVNEDSQIGLQEAVYILQTVSAE